jgi:hypothetical protein
MTPEQSRADLTVEARRIELIAQRTAITAELAHVELHLAADIVRHVFGPTAVWLLLAKDTSDDGNTVITPLVVLGGGGDQPPLWFNSSDDRYNSGDYPGACTISGEHGRPLRDMDTATREALVAHLTAAYDAVGGVSGALFVSGDDFYPSDVNVLTVSIPAALDPYEPGDPDESLAF